MLRRLSTTSALTIASAPTITRRARIPSPAAAAAAASGRCGRAQLHNARLDCAVLTPGGGNVRWPISSHARFAASSLPRSGFGGSSSIHACRHAPPCHERPPPPAGPSITTALLHSSLRPAPPMTTTTPLQPQPPLQSFPGTRFRRLTQPWHQVDQFQRPYQQQQQQQRRTYIFLPSTPSDLYRLMRSTVSTLWETVTGNIDAHSSSKRVEIAVKLRETGRRVRRRLSGGGSGNSTTNKLVPATTYRTRLRDKFEARKQISRQKFYSLKDAYRSRRLRIRDNFRARRNDGRQNMKIWREEMKARRLVGRQNMISLREEMHRTGLVAGRRYRRYRARLETGVWARLDYAVRRVRDARSLSSRHNRRQRMLSLSSSPSMPSSSFASSSGYYYPPMPTYRHKIVILDEPASPAWFDADGYPQTARDAVTGRFVNPWNSESTNGQHGLVDLWRWRMGHRNEVREELMPPSPSREMVGKGGGGGGGNDVDCALEHVRRTIYGEGTDPLPQQQQHQPSTSLSPADGGRAPTATVPTFLPDGKTWAPPSSSTSNQSKIKLTWLGHSTTLVQMDGFTLLTDPIFSHRASGTQLFGPARYVPPPIGVDDLPQTGLDAVLISHDHYDHLDYGTVLDLENSGLVRYWVVPLGLKAWLTDRAGVTAKRIVELEWWEGARFVREEEEDAIGAAAAVGVGGGRGGEVRMDGIVREFGAGDGDGGNGVGVGGGSVPSDDDDAAAAHDGGGSRREMVVTCAPAQHWCSRTPFDRNRRLWCSWAVRTTRTSASDGGGGGADLTDRGAARSDDPMDGGATPHSDGGLNFYFAGDTGLPPTFPLHRQIGDRLGPFDLSALPIGAYSPSFFMRDSHADPYEAVAIHTAVRSRRSVGIHWGTFALADERYDEPPRLLRDAVARRRGEGEAAEEQQQEQQLVDFVTVRHGGSVESPDQAIGELESTPVETPSLSEVTDTEDEER